MRVTELYPGNSDVHLRYAQMLEESGQPQKAIEQYEEAVKIEDAYREQFKVLYPGREVFSRFPVEKYEKAKGKIKEIEKNKSQIINPK
jgi:tetratricopeptide (TPR) repeat protein